MRGSCNISSGTALSGSADVDALLLLDDGPPAAAEAGERPMKRRLGGGTAEVDAMPSAEAEAMTGDLSSFRASWP